MKPARSLTLFHESSPSPQRPADPSDSYICERHCLRRNTDISAELSSPPEAQLQCPCSCSRRASEAPWQPTAGSMDSGSGSGADPSKRPVGAQLFQQYSMPCPLNSRRLTAASATFNHRSLLDEQIIHCQLSIAPKKNFIEEVRALLDVRKFVTESFVLLDLNEVCIQSIVQSVIEQLAECRHLSAQVIEEAKGLISVDRDHYSMVLANTMQGIHKSRLDGRLAYDHSWLVATAKLTSLQRRQVAIARLLHPVNFGRNSREVKFFVIVLTPNKEKLTKSAWETGRTFATMFTDIEFRRRLLRAKSLDEFKAELLVKAETLARQDQSNDDLSLKAICGHSDFKQPMGQFLSLADSYYDDASSVRPLDSSSKKKNKNKHNNNNINKHGGHNLAPHYHHHHHHHHHQTAGCFGRCFSQLGSGLADDLKRRSKYYFSDYTDGFLGERSLYKTVSTTIFLYFSVLLPCIAFGVVDTNNTDGHIDPRKTMIGQALGGLLFAVFSGQPLVVVMTTAPLCIYVKVIYQISRDFQVDFAVFYAYVGLWMALFLVILALTNSSNLMKHSTRSTEDIFAIFTAFAFGSDGIREAIRSFNKYYWEPDCVSSSGHVAGVYAPNLTHTSASSASSPHLASISARSINSNLTGHLATDEVPLPLPPALPNSMLDANSTLPAADFHVVATSLRCQRETCILFLFLMCGTLWLANSFSAFKKTPYLSSKKRELIKDYALAFSVLIFSFIGSFLFADIRLDTFEFADFTGLHWVTASEMSTIGLPALLISCLLGLILALLFYVDQNICGAMVNNAPYKLKKGDYFHLDLFVLALLNIFLSLCGLPWMQGKLPHSHLHSKALADCEERVDEGHVHEMIVNIRETRLTGILSNVLIGLSLLAVPYPLSYIPPPVLSGVFLYTALAEFKSNSMVERICLFFTEQTAYPPNHYIRRCPQRKIHLFTIAQIVQLGMVSAIGFYPNPYVNMAYPLIVVAFVPIRILFMPRLIESKYLGSLDDWSLDRQSNGS